jgi:hypothetical protein
LHSVMLDMIETRPGCPGVVSDGVQSGISVLMRTEALLRGLVLILRHHGAPDLIVLQLENQLTAYLGICPNESVWVKRVKHVLAYPLAKYLRNEPPKSTGCDFKPVGNLKKWMKCRLSAFNRKNTHLWYSWFQAKRAALPMSDDFIDQTYAEHLEALVGEDDGDDLVIDEIFEDPAFQLVLSIIRDYVTEKTDLDGYLEFQPSTNASFESTRGNGGQQRALLSLIDFQESDVASSTELFSMRWYPKCYSSKGVHLNACLETRERVGRDQWNRLISKRDTFNAAGQISCTIQGVLEPMKVRVISKGEALPYYSMKPLQKSLWSALQQFSCFRLTGRPFSPCDVQDLRSKSGPDDQWFSIDYSAATDGLSWKYSGRILSTIISGLSPRDQEIAMSVLGPHRLHYPSSRGGVTFKGVMRRGQLMGSILSFPILCLANLGVYLRAMSEHQRGWTIGEQLKSVIVNGDDMLYVAPDRYWNDHIKFGAAVGLNMSIGKSYHHSVYANVNSTSVHCDLEDKKSTPWQIDFLNTGLFFGQHKVQNSRETAGNHHDDGASNGVVTILPTLLNGCLPGKQGNILRMYIDTHSDEIKRECMYMSNNGYLVPGVGRCLSRNLFLPISIGGFGVNPPSGFKFRVTRDQKVLASYLFGGRYCPKTNVQLPLQGFPLRVHVEVEARPWSVRSQLDMMPRYNLKGLSCSRREFASLKLGFLEYSECSRAVKA